MTEADLATAAWRAWFWGEIEHWAFLAVVVALAIEFAALKIGAPSKKILEDQKDLRIAELNNETVKLRKGILERSARFLTPEQRSAIIALFKKHSSISSVSVVLMRDAESNSFGVQIAAAIRDADTGVDVRLVRGSPLPMMADGIILVGFLKPTADFSTPDPIQDFIQMAREKHLYLRWLDKDSWERFSARTHDPIQPSDIVLYVGTPPPVYSEGTPRIQFFDQLPPKGFVIEAPSEPKGDIKKP